MRNIWIIARKEFKQFFVSPVAYAIALAVFLVMGVLFYATILLGTLFAGISLTIVILSK